MRLALHIFKKDAHRLWWEIAVTFGVLAILALLDSTRTNAIPGPLEGLLNLILPAAWIYLIALLIHQEALVGDRQFWVTRPYPRRALLGAKVLFLLAFIHVPSLAGDFVIVAARGFQPLSFLPPLLWKQALLASAITLPAAALATVTRNLTQFVPIAILLVAVAGALAGNPYLIQPWIRVDEVRLAIVLIVIATGAAAIVVLQYAARRTRTSRALGLAAAATASLFFAYLPRDYTASIACTLSGRHSDSSTVSIAYAVDRGPLPEAWIPQWPGSSGQFALPITVSGITENPNRLRLDQLQFEISIPGQERWAMSTLPPTGSPPTDPVGAVMIPMDRVNWWQGIRARREVYDRIIDVPVTLSGRIAANLFREREPKVIPVSPEGRSVPGIGRCSSQLVDDGRGREMLKVLCESPHTLPLSTRVELVHPEIGALRPRSLGDGGNFLLYPGWAWLSPLERRQTFFHLTEEVPLAQGSRWLIPSTAVSDAKVELAAIELERCTIFKYELHDIVLREFVTRRPRP